MLSSNDLIGLYSDTGLQGISHDSLERIAALTTSIVDSEFRTGFDTSPYEFLDVLCGLDDLRQSDSMQKYADGVIADLLKSICFYSPQEIQNFLQETLSRQSSDGSWSTDPRISFLPDKVLTTALILQVLLRYKILPSTAAYQRGDLPLEDFAEHILPYEMALSAGYKFLNDHIIGITRIKRDKETIACAGLALIQYNRVRTLLKKLYTTGHRNISGSLLEWLNIGVNHAYMGVLKNTMTRRLAAKLGDLTSRQGTIHSVLDVLTEAGLEDPDVWVRIGYQQNAFNGSLGLYPSSTMAWLLNVLPALDEKDWVIFQQHTSTVEKPCIETCYQQVQLLSVSESFKTFWRALAYLKDFLVNAKGVPPFYPADQFEIWWALMSLSRTSLAEAVASSIGVYSFDSYPLDQSIGITRGFLTDVDTTAMRIATLANMGVEVSLDPLNEFYVPERRAYMCYPHENRISPSANIHALMAITAVCRRQYGGQLPEQHTEAFYGSLTYLLQLLQDADHFEDKWHLSDLYASGHGVELFCDLLEWERSSGVLGTYVCERLQEEIQRLAGFILSHARTDGGFSSIMQQSSSFEETGYAVSALVSIEEAGLIQLDSALLSRAYQFLSEAFDRSNTDGVGMRGMFSTGIVVPIWIAKTLYGSAPIAMAAGIAAKVRLEQRLLKRVA
jgi:hypothetical protein